MRPWDEPPVVMLPAFEGRDQSGDYFRSDDRRQHHHLVVVFAEKADPRLTALAARFAEVRVHNGDLVVVTSPGADLGLPGSVPVVEDADGAIAAKYRPLVTEWTPPVAFVADRYGEIMQTTDGEDPDLAEHVIGWLFSAEVQCAL